MSTLRIPPLVAPIAALTIGLLAVNADAAEPFTYDPPGQLIPGSGTGLATDQVYAPDMVFPLQDRGFANSQVYRYGGYLGPAGSQCHASNYDYPWQDNYCETRQWAMPLCPSGQGHQGQDIRPETCTDQAYWTVATDNATVTNIGSYSVYITDASGRRYDYLHGRGQVVGNGQAVAQGAQINRVSNNMGNTPTSIHLHFNIRQDVGGYGVVYVSPYNSLIKAYEEKFGLTNIAPTGYLDAATCQQISGWAQDPDDPESPVSVHVYFNGPAGDPNAVGVALSANEYREDLCGAIGSCDHAYSLGIPMSLRDAQPHPVHAYGIDSEGGENAQLTGSPKTITCGGPPLPDGVRRHVSSPEILAAWAFSPFWHQLTLDDATLGSIPTWDPIEPTPLMIRADDQSPEVWILDGIGKRHVPSPEVAENWSLDLGTVETLPAAEVAAIPTGTPLWDRPFLLKGTGPEVYLLDDRQCYPGDDDPECADGGDTGAGETSGGGEGSGGDGEGSDGDGPGDESGGDSGSDDDGLPPGYGFDRADDGCGCTTDGSNRSNGAWGLSLLGLIALRRRRRE
ncbi:MYXO-CTERM sorting domain-containing protein [Enhygromyxa salina]|uniref:Peptidase family M23 n=1 Tax=Enhygromyxa salina TaxID=215803 RepID=A0A2S9YRY1_9BACT|nr:MYXO-CTERM sorting domain-containing protein [Enhygromyxa salina]PRQ07851.1 Peptidase family M23 [Enhygromyxa salina]